MMRALLLVALVACHHEPAYDPFDGAARLVPPGDDGPTSTAPLVFEYRATDGMFGTTLDVWADGSWRHVEHSGHAKPRGQLSAAELQQLTAALAAAKFQRSPKECVHHHDGEQLVRDVAHHREVRTDCAIRFDESTRALVRCAHHLIHGDDC